MRGKNKHKYEPTNLINKCFQCWIEGGNKSFVKSANECKKKSAGSHISVDEAWLRYAKNEFPNVSRQIRIEHFYQQMPFFQGGENVEYCLRGVKVDSLTWDATTDANTKSVCLKNNFANEQISLSFAF